jgi:hypothetical protein
LCLCLLPNTAILELDHLLEEAILLSQVIDLDLELAVLVLQVPNVALDRLDVMLLFCPEPSRCNRVSALTCCALN